MSKSNSVKMPQTKEECAAAIAALGTLNHQMEGLQAELDREVGELTARAESEIAPLREERDRTAAVIKSFCETRRKDLTKGAKSYKFTTGTVKWRTGSVRVSFKDGREDLVINNLVANGHTACVSVKKSVDKKAAAKLPADQREKIEGLIVKRGPETFTIDPHKIEADRVPEPDIEGAAV